MVKRADENQFEIIQKLRAVGVSVQPLHNVGFGCPDLVCGFCGRNVLMEVKMVGEKLRPDQQKWHDLWKGQVHIVYSWQDAYRKMGIKI